MDILRPANNSATPEFWKNMLSGVGNEGQQQGFIVRAGDFEVLAERARTQHPDDKLTAALAGALASAYHEIARLRGNDSQGIPQQVIQGLSDAAFRTELPGQTIAPNPTIPPALQVVPPLTGHVDRSTPSTGITPPFPMGA